MAKNNIEAIYRLSPLQEGILYHNLKSPDTGVYFTQFSCTLDGLEDSARWQQAWSAVAQRHAIMRTLFSWERREQPLQIVREHVVLPWEVLDWRDLSPLQRDGHWTALLQRDRARGFDFSKAPLMRFTLARENANDYRFLWSFHHILLDGWSQRLLLSEALAYYRGSGEGAAADLQTPPSYADFIRWLGGIDHSRARDFWSAQLEGFTRPSEFSPRASDVALANERTNTRVMELEIAPAVATRLSSSAQGEKLTLNTLILGAWARVLSVHVGADDVVFGTTVSGRPTDLPGVERTAGLFINTLPYRVRVPTAGSVAEWLHTLQSNQVRLREFEQTALVDIQRWSSLPAGTPLFQSILVFEKVPTAGAIEDCAPTLRNLEYREFSHYPLAILVDPAQGLKLIAVYREEYFDPGAVSRLLAQVQAVLEQMCNSLQLPVGELSVVPEQERDLMLLDWNQTQTTWPHQVCVHQLIEQQAAQHPQRKAVVSGEDVLSFAELNGRANQLAHYLMQQGVGEGALVPVFLERSGAAIVAFLAVLKTGAAYIPLDASSPKVQLREVLDDIPEPSPVVVTQASLVENLPPGKASPLCVDLLEDLLTQCPADNPGLLTGADALAYVIYTSGSTGKAKGVMIEHRSLLNATLARTDYYQQQPGVFLLLSSFATDSSLAGLYWSLCAGATLVLAGRRAEQDVAKLGELIQQQKVSHMLCVPSLYQLIIEHSRIEQLAGLEVVIVAGEACSKLVIRQHQALLPAAGLFNEYGPSECTVWASVAELSDYSPWQAVSIGRPIANTRFYILDDTLRPVPVGVAGELYIGGVGVARGYLNQPETSAAAFLASPFTGYAGSAPGERLYKTGDRVRYLDNGMVEFIGRVDNQLKLRGYRVEPEQIESTLASHPGVAEAVVFVQEDAIQESEERALSRRLGLLQPDQAEALLLEVERPLEVR